MAWLPTTGAEIAALIGARIKCRRLRCGCDSRHRRSRVGGMNRGVAEPKRVVQYVTVPGDRRDCSGLRSDPRFRPNFGCMAGQSGAFPGPCYVSRIGQAR